MDAYNQFLAASSALQGTPITASSSLGSPASVVLQNAMMPPQPQQQQPQQAVTPQEPEQKEATPAGTILDSSTKPAPVQQQQQQQEDTSGDYSDDLTHAFNAFDKEKTSKEHLQKLNNDADVDNWIKVSNSQVKEGMKKREEVLKTAMAKMAGRSQNDPEYAKVLEAELNYLKVTGIAYESNLQQFQQIFGSVSGDYFGTPQFGMHLKEQFTNFSKQRNAHIENSMVNLLYKVDDKTGERTFKDISELEAIKLIDEVQSTSPKYTPSKIKGMFVSSGGSPSANIYNEIKNKIGDSSIPPAVIANLAFKCIDTDGSIDYDRIKGEINTLRQSKQKNQAYNSLIQKDLAYADKSAREQKEILSLVDKNIELRTKIQSWRNMATNNPFLSAIEKKELEENIRVYTEQADKITYNLLNRFNTMAQGFMDNPIDEYTKSTEAYGKVVKDSIKARKKWNNYQAISGYSNQRGLGQ